MGWFLKEWSSSSQVIMEVAAAVLVLKKAWPARAPAPSALPPLNCEEVEGKEGGGGGG